MKRFNWIMLAGFGIVLLIAAHGLVAWGGIKLSSQIGGWLPWIAGGVLMAFGLYHVGRHIHGTGPGHFIFLADTRMTVGKSNADHTMASS